MSTREIPVRYHHSHNLSTGSSTSTGTSSSSGSDLSTPPSSVQTHSHNPFRTRSRRPTTSNDSHSRKSPPSSPRGGFFRHKFHGETQTSSSSTGSVTLVSVELSRIESAGVTPTQANFTATPQQQPQQVSQSWFHRRRHEDADNDEAGADNDDANSDASFGCGLAAEFDKHVGILRADPSSISTSTLSKEPILAAAWNAKMTQADERQAWLDTVFFRLKARANGASGQELHNIHAPSRRTGAASGSGKSLLETVGMERSDSGNGSKPSATSDGFLDLSGLINPCPRPGSVYLSRFIQERKSLANKPPSLAHKSSKIFNQSPSSAPFSNFVFPPQPAGSSLTVAAAGSGSEMNTTPRPPPMQRFASSDQVLTRGRTGSNSALRQTAINNAAASTRSNQQQMQYGTLRGTMSQDLHWEQQQQQQQLQQQAQQQRMAPRSGTKSGPVGTRERSASDAARRHRPAHGSGSGDIPAVMVPTLPDWAKQANRTLHRSRQSGGDGSSISGDSTHSRQSQPTELPYFASNASMVEYLEPEPMARAVSHDTRLQGSRTTLLSRASTNSLRRTRQPEALQISHVGRPSQHFGSSGLAQSYGVDMEISLSSPGSIMTATSSSTSSRESFGSTNSYSTSGSGPLTPRTPEHYLAALPVPHPQHHFPGAHLAGNYLPPLPKSGAKESMGAPGRVTVIRTDALGSIELDAEDEDALLSGTGRFALSQGPLSFFSRAPKQQQPLLAPEELMPISRELDFEQEAAAMVPMGRSASSGMGPRQSGAQYSSHMGRCGDATPVHTNRPRANTMGTALLPQLQLLQ
ncbi:hypothetical protein CF327_g1795 [Tilletia walkeri]|uniref:Uncharacterized protein n=1 Tax=Tilletia walkeri TaxID=117179 RepID=A0A8X7NF90_9BASI|nr:hypothetical protein CF327_g1795 [Tilletia walkeri]KAE8271988.1 hypothetical protein A4X09_0g362 [Tilletia walkeri]